MHAPVPVYVVWIAFLTLLMLAHLARVGQVILSLSTASGASDGLKQ